MVFLLSPGIIVVIVFNRVIFIRVLTGAGNISIIVNLARAGIIAGITSLYKAGIITANIIFVMAGILVLPSSDQLQPRWTEFNCILDSQPSKLACQSCTELGPAQPQLVLLLPRLEICWYCYSSPLYLIVLLLARLFQ